MLKKLYTARSIWGGILTGLVFLELLTVIHLQDYGTLVVSILITLTITIFVVLSLSLLFILLTTLIKWHTFENIKEKLIRIREETVYSSFFISLLSSIGIFVSLQQLALDLAYTVFTLLLATIVIIWVGIEIIGSIFRRKMERIQKNLNHLKKRLEDNEGKIIDLNTPATPDVTQETDLDTPVTPDVTQETDLDTPATPDVTQETDLDTPATPDVTQETDLDTPATPENTPVILDGGNNVNRYPDLKDLVQKLKSTNSKYCESIEALERQIGQEGTASDENISDLLSFTELDKFEKETNYLRYDIQELIDNTFTLENKLSEREHFLEDWSSLPEQFDYSLKELTKILENSTAITNEIKKLAPDEIVNIQSKLENITEKISKYQKEIENIRSDMMSDNTQMTSEIKLKNIKGYFSLVPNVNDVMAMANQLKKDLVNHRNHALETRIIDISIKLRENSEKLNQISDKLPKTSKVTHNRLDMENKKHESYLRDIADKIKIQRFNENHQLSFNQLSETEKKASELFSNIEALKEEISALVKKIRQPFT